jgi:multisubunit Na+/H+ antiporter MnhE subunit
MSSPEVVLVEVLAWCPLLFGLWLLTLASVSIAESIAAGISAVLCAVIARAGRRASRVRWHPDPGWLRWFALLPIAICVDTVRVFAIAVRMAFGRPAPQRWDRIELPADRSTARADARRAAAVLALSTAPGSFVVDAPPDGPLLVHTLVSVPPRIDERVGR